MTPGDQFEWPFQFSQQQVDAFAEITGDDNPLHLDSSYAANTKFGRPIMHGFLGGSVFSQIIGTKFPGEGTFYLKQSLIFRQPMFVDTPYKAILTVQEINETRHWAKIQTVVQELDSGRKVLTGEAEVMNPEKIGRTNPPETP